MCVDQCNISALLCYPKEITFYFAVPGNFGDTHFEICVFPEIYPHFDSPKCL